jgi:hypothetical protein
MAHFARIRVRDCLRISCEEVVDRFHDVIYHPHELIVHERRMHVLHHEVIDGPHSVAQTKWKCCRGILSRYAEESGSPLVSCVMTLANEKDRWHKFSWDGRGPRKMAS